MEGLNNVTVKDQAATFYELEMNKASPDAPPITGIMVLKTSIAPSALYVVISCSPPEASMHRTTVDEEYS